MIFNIKALCNIYTFQFLLIEFRRFFYANMPFAGKRSYAPSYGRRTRRRMYATTRKKVGYRKYVRKASSRVYAKPARFLSKRGSRIGSMVAKSIRSMAETKIIPWRQVDYAQPITTTAPGVSTVKFVAGQQAVPAFANYTPVGGFNTNQGSTKNDRDGQFIWLKGSTVNLTVQLDNEVPLGSRAGPITFRAICFKLKRALSPAGITTSPDLNLFLKNNGSVFGDTTASPNNMTVPDFMLQPINTNNFHVICDKRFTLCHTQESSSNSVTNNFAVQNNQKSFKVMPFRLRCNTKARVPLGTDTEPVDFDFRYCWAIYAYYPNDPVTSQGDIPITWSASIRGSTGFNDV